MAIYSCICACSSSPLILFFDTCRDAYEHTTLHAMVKGSTAVPCLLAVHAACDSYVSFKDDPAAVQFRVDRR